MESEMMSVMPHHTLAFSDTGFAERPRTSSVTDTPGSWPVMTTAWLTADLPRLRKEHRVSECKQSCDTTCGKGWVWPEKGAHLLEYQMPVYSSSAVKANPALAEPQECLPMEKRYPSSELVAQSIALNQGLFRAKTCGFTCEGRGL